MIDWPALKRLNDPLNAFVEWDEKAASRPGPLSGRTVGVKTNIAVAGLKWTAGLGAYRDRVATRDAETVAALRNAGAAIIGTLNMEEAALGAVTRNPHYGWTRNPHSPGYTPGGSSGGSAAAVAAGLCDLALGSDTMGSIRIPASYCGIYGFKPANDRVSQDGLELAEPAFDCVGPLARSLDLLDTASRILSRFGDGETGEILLLSNLGGVDVSPEVLKVYQRAVDALGAGGELMLDWPLSRIRYAGFIRVAAYLSSSLDDQLVSPGLRKLLSYGPRRTAADRDEDLKILEATGAAIGDALGKGAMLLMPTAPQAAFADAVDPPANQSDFTCLANIAGVSAISIPAGLDEAGLPIGAQLLAAGGREAGLFAAADRLDQALHAYRPPSHFLQGEPA